MTLWIIMGSLVGVVAIFLVVMSIKDKKKNKLEKLKKEELKVKISDSKKNVIIFLNQIIIKNDLMMKNFIPSVGKYKMSEIKSGANKSFIEFKKTNEFKLAKEGKENIKLINIFNDFNSINSNIWEKKMKIQIEDIKKEFSKLPKELIEEYKIVVKKVIKKGYA